MSYDCLVEKAKIGYERYNNSWPEHLRPENIEKEANSFWWWQKHATIIFSQKYVPVNQRDYNNVLKSPYTEFLEKTSLEIDSQNRFFEWLKLNKKIKPIKCCCLFDKMFATYEKIKEYDYFGLLP